MNYELNFKAMRVSTFRQPYMAIFLSVILLFVSCTENSVTTMEEANTRLFTDLEIEEIGVLHNDYLRQSLALVSTKQVVLSKEKERSLKEAIVKVNAQGLTHSQKEELFDKASLNTNSIKEQVSKKVIDFIDTIENALENFNAYQDLENDFDVIASQARNELIGPDLDQVLIMLSIGKNSANFWLPKELGGSNEGYRYLSKINAEKYKANISARTSWKAVIVNDLFGGLEGAIGWGLSIAIAGGPVTLVPYLVSIGFGAAMSSIKAAM